MNRPSAGKIGNTILWAVAGAFLVFIALVDPEKFSNRLRDFFHITDVPRAAQPRIIKGQDDLPYGEMFSGLDNGRIRRTVENLAGFGSRVPGTEGHEKAFQYVKARFDELFGAENVTVETFPMVVPVDEGARLELAQDGGSIPLYGLWPNYVKPNTVAPEGLSGELAYCGKGNYANFNGVNLKGKIVVLDFESGDNYLNARKWGASAVIFVPRGRIHIGEAEAKWMDQPADVPRFYADESAAEKLLAAAEKGRPARLFASMVWREVEGHNIYANLASRPGQGAGNEPWRTGRMVYAAHYDSISVVPRLAPGAEDACGLAALLELAHAAKKYGAYRPITFLATDGHYQGLAGAADFMRKHYAREPRSFQTYMDFDLYRSAQKGGVFAPLDFNLWVSLDLSSHGDAVAALAMPFLLYYDNRPLTAILSVIGKEFTRYGAELWGEEIRFFDAIGAQKKPAPDYFGRVAPMDHEVPVSFGQWAVGLQTTNDSRNFVDTPMNLSEKMDWPGLFRQVQTVVGILMRAARDEGPSKIARPIAPITTDVYGAVVWYDPRESMFVPAANLYQPGIPGRTEAAYPPLVVYKANVIKSLTGVRTLIATQAARRKVPFGNLQPSEKEQFLFPAARFWTFLASRKVEVRAYAIDRAGKIVFAPDMGQEGAENYGLETLGGGLQIVTFPCRAFTILDAIDPRYLVALDQPYVYQPNSAVPTRWGIDSPTRGFTAWLVYGRTAPLAAVVYMEPGSRFKYAAGVNMLGPKFLLLGVPEELSPASRPAAKAAGVMPDQARGQGYLVDDGILFHPLYNAARDMWVLDDMWIRLMDRYNVRNERLLALHDASLLGGRNKAQNLYDARTELLSAAENLDKLRYDAYSRHAQAALGLEARAYPEVLSSANDTVKGIVFYFALLIPFSFFMERLLFGFADIRKRIAGFSGVFLAVFALLRMVHPAFSLTRSPYVVLLAFVILVLSVIVIVIILGKFGQELRKMKVEAHGVYESDVGRLSATSAAISLGIANLRRRPLRTALTAATVTLITFTVLSFTSVKSSVEFFRLPRKGEPNYSGALLRTRDLSPLYPVVTDYVRGAFGDVAEILPRYWYFARLYQDRFFDVVNARGAGRTYAQAMLGTAAAEKDFIPVEKALIGPSRWLPEGRDDVCLLSDVTAGNLNITPESLSADTPPRVKVQGNEFEVVGIFDSRQLARLTDLDGEPILPAAADPLVSSMSEANILASELSYSQDIRPVKRLDAAAVVIFTASAVRDMGGALVNIAIKSSVPEKEFLVRLKQFLSRVGIVMFVSEGDHVVAYSSFGTTNLRGLKNLLVPILIAALIVLNAMMGAVAERGREIGIYSSVGLAPTHIGALFLAESWVFGTVGAVLGYLLGQAVASLVALTGWLGGITLNYSSFSAVSCTLIVMLTVFLSTIYPAKVAAARAVPDVTRRWKLPAPQGDQWVFDFPFTVAGGDITGLYVFLTHFFSSYTESSIGEFYAEDVRLEKLDGAGGRVMRASLVAWIAPFDLGISQRVELDAVDTGEHNIFRVEVSIRRLSGDVSSWKRMNRGFLDLLRKRFLVWRTVPAGLKGKLREEGLAVLAGAAPTENGGV